ncbi:hypothetical protein [Pseudomonas sp.]|uniref:crAss001_48 related protein n=1 Tax=Pseudomonas sp. TaxID=306 RepID=UPI002583E421|nr:hypothetical protein [Pseudomonas sp.]
MQQFIGTKIIKARSMTRAEFVAYRYPNQAANPDAGAPEDDGYLVEYTDGGQPNHPEHEGYISWSPKQQFEAAYLKLGTIGHMYPHEQRVVGELVQLSIAREKLGAFLASGRVLEDGHLPLLMQQHEVMGLYADILRQRIALFKREIPEDISAVMEPTGIDRVIGPCGPTAEHDPYPRRKVVFTVSTGDDYDWSFERRTHEALEELIAFARENRGDKSDSWKAGLHAADYPKRLDFTATNGLRIRTSWPNAFGALYAATQPPESVPVLERADIAKLTEQERIGMFGCDPLAAQGSEKEDAQ